LFEKFDETRNLFLTDYADPREAFDGSIEVKTLSEREIRDAIRYYHAYANIMTFTIGYLKNLESALQINPKSDCLVACEKVY
jgi:hypothetical protein